MYTEMKHYYQVVFIGRNRETNKLVKVITRSFEKPWFYESWQFADDLKEICDKLEAKTNHELTFKSFVDSNLLNE